MPEPPATSAPSARSLRDDLAELVARAVREGNLGLAKALIDAQANAPEAKPADVVDLDLARVRRRP
jgi:hypothetical protein